MQSLGNILTIILDIFTMFAFSSSTSIHMFLPFIRDLQLGQ